MNQTGENSGVRLKTAFSDQYIGQLIKKFAPNPLWTGPIDIDIVGTMDVSAVLVGYEIIDVRHEQIGLTMDLKIDCKKSTGLIRPSVAIAMKIDLSVTPIFENHIWTDLKIDILKMDVLDNSKIRVGLITLSNSMVERILSKLKHKIEDNIQSMINVPQMVIALSKSIPDQIPILIQPKIYLDANISNINVADIIKKEEKYQVKGNIASYVHICDEPINQGMRMPFLMSNHKEEHDVHCPVKIELKWSTLTQLINEHIGKADGLPEGVVIHQVDISSVRSRLILNIKGDLKGIEKIRVYFILNLNNNQLEISDVDLDNIDGSFLMKNLLKVSENIVVAKSVEVINKKINELLALGKDSVLNGLTHQLQFFNIGTRAEDIILTDLVIRDDELTLLGEVHNLTFELSD